jgi:hypothetical protein
MTEALKWDYGLPPLMKDVSEALEMNSLLIISERIDQSNGQQMQGNIV